MVELTRGWNSRLGFSLQSEGENTVISVVHPDSVAAKDGRLKQGDIVIMVCISFTQYDLHDDITSEISFDEIEKKSFGF